MKNVKSLLLTLCAISSIISSNTTQCIDLKDKFKKASFPAKSAMCAGAYLAVGIPAIVTTAVLPPNRISCKIAGGIGLTCLAPLASIDIVKDEIIKGIKYGSSVKNITKDVAKTSIPAVIGFVAVPYALHKHLDHTPADISVADSDELLEPQQAVQS